MAIDQGWAKIFRINENACVGLVDEKQGSLRATPDKPVLLTLVVDDVNAWHARLSQAGVAGLTEPKLHAGIGVYGFFCEDPGGYMVEIQRFVNS